MEESTRLRSERISGRVWSIAVECQRAIREEQRGTELTLEDMSDNLCPKLLLLLVVLLPFKLRGLLHLLALPPALGDQMERMLNRLMLLLLLPSRVLLNLGPCHGAVSLGDLVFGVGVLRTFSMLLVTMRRTKSEIIGSEEGNAICSDVTVQESSAAVSELGFRHPRSRIAKLTSAQSFLRLLTLVDEPRQTMEWEVFGIVIVLPVVLGVLGRPGELPLGGEILGLLGIGLEVVAVLGVVVQGSVENFEDGVVGEVEDGGRMMRGQSSGGARSSLLLLGLSYISLDSSDGLVNCINERVEDLLRFGFEPFDVEKLGQLGLVGGEVELRSLEEERRGNSYGCSYQQQLAKSLEPHLSELVEERAKDQGASGVDATWTARKLRTTSPFALPPNSLASKDCSSSSALLAR